MKRKKRCAKCGIEKSPDSFYKHERNLDGLQSYCKTFQQEQIRIWRGKNSEHMKRTHEHYRIRIANRGASITGSGVRGIEITGGAIKTDGLGRI